MFFFMTYFGEEINLCKNYCRLFPMFWIEALPFAFLKKPEETSVKTWGPDSFWLHHPYQSHGMQTLDRPVLVLWGWIGNLKDYDFHYLPSHLVERHNKHSKSPMVF